MPSDSYPVPTWRWYGVTTRAPRKCRMRAAAGQLATDPSDGDNGSRCSGAKQRPPMPMASARLNPGSSRDSKCTGAMAEKRPGGFGARRTRRAVTERNGIGLHWLSTTCSAFTSVHATPQKTGAGVTFDPSGRG